MTDADRQRSTERYAAITQKKRDLWGDDQYETLRLAAIGDVRAVEEIKHIDAVTACVTKWFKTWAGLEEVSDGR